MGKTPMKSHNSHPKVSVVSISYNQEEYIRDTLEGFVTQKVNFDFEIVIADDGSTDKTPDIIREYAKAYPKLFHPILRPSNVGVQHNLIRALQEASGDYIALCEGDDFWTDVQKLQKQSDFLDGNPEHSMCFHRATVFFQNSEEPEFLSPPEAEIESYDTLELLRRNFIPTPAVMYRRQSYDSLPGNVMPLDWYLHLFHARFGKIGFIGDVMAACRRHAAGVWWGAYATPDEHWRKQGPTWLALYTELLTLYGDKREAREIIEASIVTLLNTFVRIDGKNSNDLLDKAIIQSPLSGVLLVKNLVAQVAGLDAHSKEQAKIIQHYVDLSEQLQQKNVDSAARLKKFEAKPLYRVKQAARRIIKK
jgi:glycosyltransferase involved in cell wall biosynthesis